MRISVIEVISVNVDLLYDDFEAVTTIVRCGAGHLPHKFDPGSTLCPITTDQSEKVVAIGLVING